MLAQPVRSLSFMACCEPCRGAWFSWQRTRRGLENRYCHLQKTHPGLLPLGCVDACHQECTACNRGAPTNERPSGPKIDRAKAPGRRQPDASILRPRSSLSVRSAPAAVNSSTLRWRQGAELLHHQLAGKPTSVLDDDRADAVSSTLASSAAKPSATLDRIAAQLRSSGGALAAPGSWALLPPTLAGANAPAG